MNYYNEFDPRAAAWLRELMAAKLIPEGKLDERDIRDVRRSDLAGFTQCHFFAGIGGWPLALALAGWPEAEPVWTGSCPCQPFSVAGKRQGKKDARHLWPQFRRLIRQCRPPVIFIEQVASADGRLWLDGVFADLEALAYANGAADLCAAGIGAPHIRQRLLGVAHRLNRGSQDGRPKDHQANDCGDRPKQIHADLMPKVAELRAACGMADAASLPSAEQRVEPGRREGTGPHHATERGGFADGMADAGYGKRGRSPQPESGCENASLGDQETIQPGRCSGIDGLVHSDSAGCVEQCGLKPVETKQPGIECPSRYGWWGDFDIIPCRDGKARRIESGVFPLAHGVPGRVGLLRGYGNAIVPAIVAQFIQSYREVR